MKALKNIPNAITGLNLLSGCIGLVYVMQGDLNTAAYLILVGAIFDFLDGFAARLLKVSSELGKELDSLADMVTFSLLPSFIVYELLNRHFSNFLPFIAFLIAISSAFRLAKFNLDTRQKVHFIGMPTPANAFLIAGLMFIISSGGSFGISILDTPVFLISFVIMSSFLLNVPLNFISLKTTKIQVAGNEFRILLLFGSLILLFFFKFHGLFLIMTLYIILSLIQNFTRKD